MLNRLCCQLIECHGDFSQTVLVGLQPRGVLLLNQLVQLLKENGILSIQKGKLDTTFFRDDFRRNEIPHNANTTEMEINIEGKNVVLMPSFVNIGAYVDDGTMVDTWTTVGSCAQIGKNCHLSGGVGIGGVLEPLQANPVIIEDNCFVGARSEVAEGVIVREGSVISMGVYLGASTKIINRETGEITYGEVPAFSVIVPGNLPNKDPSRPGLYCAVIVKTVDAQTRSKTSINDLLRE